MRLCLCTSTFRPSSPAKKARQATRCAVCGALFRPKRASRCHAILLRPAAAKNIGEGEISRKSEGPAILLAACHELPKIPAVSSGISKEEIGSRGHAIPWPEIIETEVIEAHDWEPVTSSDGVKNWAVIGRFSSPSRKEP